MLSAISFVLFSSVGIGLLALFPLYYGKRLRLVHGAWVLSAGMLVRYGMVLLIPSLERAARLGVLCAAAGVAVFSLALYKKKTVLRARRPQGAKYLALVVIAAALFGKTLAQPLVGWDARSIWFFHGKMIYVNDGLSPAAGLNDGSVAFSHPGYPKFVASLAALGAHFQGSWNEYAPKFALFEVQLAALLFTFLFFEHSYRFAFLLLFLPLQFGGHLWSGYMDAHLAWFSGLGLLFFTRSAVSGSRAMAVSAILTSGVVLALKGEGVVYLLVIVVIGALSVAWASRSKRILSGIKTHPFSCLYLLAVAVTPFAAWIARRKALGVPSELWLDPGTFTRLATRLHDGHSLREIVAATFRHSHLQLSLIVLALVVVWQATAGRREPSEIGRAVFAPFGAAALYYACLVFIYLTTPNDLSWHLGTSVDRTMLTVCAFLVVAIYVLIGDNGELRRRQFAGHARRAG